MLDLTLLCAVAGFVGLLVQRNYWPPLLKKISDIGIVLTGIALIYLIYWPDYAIEDSTLATSLRMALRQFGPSVLFGLVAGYFLFLTTADRSLTLIAACAFFAAAPILLEAIPSLSRYVQEFKTPWFEAKLVDRGRTSTVSTELSQLLDRSAGSELTPRAYAFLLSRVRADEQIQSLLGQNATEPTSSTSKALRSVPDAHPSTPSAGLPSAATWLEATLEPVLLCAWKTQRATNDEKLVRAALTPVTLAGATLFFNVNKSPSSARDGPDPGFDGWVKDFK